MAGQITRIVRAEALPESGKGCYVHFHHKVATQTSWTFCDTRAIVGEHHEAWLDEIDAWHGDLCRRAAAKTPAWWFVVVARMTAWGPVDLKPLLFSLAVIEACIARRPERLYLLECPDEVVDYLEEWTQQSEGAAVLVRQDQDRVARVSRGDPRGLIGVFRAFASLVAGMLRADRASGPMAPADVIVFSSLVSKAAMEQVGDHFFGRALDGSVGPTVGRFAWLYDVRGSSDRRWVKRYCESIGRPVTFVVEWLRWADVAGILRECVSLASTLRIVGREVPDLAVGHLKSNRFPRRFWQRFVTWQWPVGEFAMRRAMTRYIAAVRATAVIYPYEEKGIERSILAACQAEERPVKAVGFAHAAYSKGHVFARRAHAAGRPQPDLLAATGPAAQAWLIESAGVPAVEVTTIGSPRFAQNFEPHITSGGRRVLFVVGFGFEIGLLVRFVEEQPDLFDGYDLVIRRSFHSWQAEQDRWLDELRDIGVPYTVEAAPLQRQLADADIVIVSSTSAGIESMLQGRATIHVALHDVVPVDPFQGKVDHPAVLSCATPTALRGALSRLAELNDQEYDTLTQAQRGLATQIYAPFDARAFARMLDLSSSPDDANAVEDTSYPRSAVVST
jgi:hypothetical protein